LGEGHPHTIATKENLDRVRKQLSTEDGIIWWVAII
jgi:hypothetical protein